jgi:tRNA(Ile)-lysidine synthase
MALLVLLCRFFSGRVVAAHLEHGFRGEASMADAEFVAEFCKGMGVACFVRHGDVANDIRRGESAEMAGRRARYEFFSDLMESEALPFVATGHTADDAAETMLLNLCRGTGLYGLTGIRERRDRVVRPLISCFREDLRTFLRESGIPWREDETNGDNSYQRNKIRNQLIPWIRSNMNPSVERSLAGLAEECRESVSASVEEAGTVAGLISRPCGAAMAAWDTVSARALGRARLASVIREQGMRLGLPTLDRKRVAELTGLILRSNRWRFQWAGDVEVCGSGSLIGWVHRGSLSPPGDVSAELGIGESASLQWGSWRIELKMVEKISHPGREGNDAPERGGVWRAALPSGPGRAGVTVTSAEDARAGVGPIPWWDGYNRPFISWKCENFSGSWLPGVFNGMHVEGSCVIMACVLAGVDLCDMGGIILE